MILCELRPGRGHAARGPGRRRTYLALPRAEWALWPWGFATGPEHDAGVTGRSPSPAPSRGASAALFATLASGPPGLLQKRLIGRAAGLSMACGNLSPPAMRTDECLDYLLM